MTEVPDYLLQRSRERRAALGLAAEGDGPAVAPAASPDAPVKAETAAAATTPAAAPVEKAPPPPPPKKPWVVAAESRRKMPVWVVPVLLFLPIWAFIYVGTLEEPTRPARGALGTGGEIYAAACASCHGATGGGGVGPQLSGGEVLLTFPTVEDHIELTLNGSGIGAPYGDPNRPGGVRVGTGGMPAHGSLSLEELVGVVLYERVSHGGQPEAELTQWIEFAESGAAAPPLGSSSADILAAFEAAGGVAEEAAG